MGRLAKAITAIGAALVLSAGAGQAAAAVWIASDVTSPGAVLMPQSTSGAVGHILATGGDASGLPEPAAWSILIVGFGAVGSVLRRRRVA